MSFKDKVLHFLKLAIDLIWPVKISELKKFLPLSLMLTLIIFVYHVLRATKDAAIIPALGAEMISTVKLWGVLPFAILFMLLYTKLTNLIQRENLFYLITAIFLSFFAIYGFVLYPIQDKITLDLSLIKAKLPAFKYPIMMLENWAVSMFYVMSELWGSVMLSLLFWQFANQVTPVDQAKRFYSLFGLLGQIGMVSAGIFNSLVALVHKENVGVHTTDIWGVTLVWIVNITLVAGIVLMATYWWINRYVLTDPLQYDPELVKQEKSKASKKVKLSITESLKYIFTSRYLGMIAVLVICYGVSINLVEAVWKNQASMQFPSKNEYLEFMGNFQIWSAFAIMIGMVVSVNIIRRIGWFAGAIITPAIVLITGVLFFIFIIMKDSLEPTLAAIGTTALMMSVIVGAIQNILSKAIKYSAFDATKEMAYIPIDDELKVKGKAAVDVVGARLGKSGGAFIQQILFAVTSLSIPFLTYEIFGIFIIIMFVWFYGVFTLSKAFETQVEKQSNK